MSLSAPAPERAKEEAAAWFARLNTRSISAGALEEFRLWRQTPGNREAYASIEAIWRKTGALKGHPELGDAVEGALARTRKSAPAGALLVGLRSRPVTSLSIAALATLALVLGLRIFESRSDYATAVGEDRLVHLADGSQVRLDTSSEIKVHFASGVRRVELVKGQAFFQVAHDPSRPFIVQAGKTDVRATGTRFDVRRDDGVVRVTLLEGSVEVRAAQSSGPGHWALRPGQQLRLGAGLATPTTADVTAATSWTSRRITFQAVPLSTAIAEVNRYSARKVVLDAPGVGAIPVGGVFDCGDTDAFVAAVSDLQGLRAVRQADGSIHLVAASHPSAG